MGFTARKSIKLAPGVRMTFSKSGVSYSVGTKGYRVTKTASGRVQRTTSIPGTGISHTKASSGGRSDPSAPAYQPPKPGWLAPKGEKELFKAVQAGDGDAMCQAGREHPEFSFAATVLSGLFKFRQGDTTQARELLEWAFAQGRDPAGDPFLSKYCSASRITLEVAPGVVAELGLDRSTIGLALAELHQDTRDVSKAIEVVEQLEPTTFAALSLAELYSQAGEHDEVVALTQGVQNEDDATALLCVFRGAALREKGYCDAAREALKEALKSKKRAPEARHRALWERARTYEAEGKRGMARKDLERIMAEDSFYPGLADAIAKLTNPKEMTRGDSEAMFDASEREPFQVTQQPTEQEPQPATGSTPTPSQDSTYTCSFCGQGFDSWWRAVRHERAHERAHTAARKQELQDKLDRRKR